MITWTQKTLQQFHHLSSVLSGDMNVQAFLENVHLKLRQFRTIQTEQLKSVGIVYDHCGNGFDTTKEWMQPLYDMLQQADHVMPENTSLSAQDAMTYILQEFDILYTVERDIQKHLQAIADRPESTDREQPEPAAIAIEGEEVVTDGETHESELEPAWHGEELPQIVSAGNDTETPGEYEPSDDVEEVVEESPKKRKRYSRKKRSTS